MTKNIELCNVDSPKGKHIIKVVSVILFWSHLNDVSITGGLALNEYANIKKIMIKQVRKTMFFSRCSPTTLVVHGLIFSRGKLIQ